MTRTELATPERGLELHSSNLDPVAMKGTASSSETMRADPPPAAKLAPGPPAPVAVPATDKKRNVWQASMDASFEKSWEKREANAGKPDSIAQRKLAVLLVLAIVGYTSYVVIGRLYVRRELGGSRSERVAVLSVYCVLLSLFVWAYATVCLTSPGYAKQHVPHGASVPPPSESYSQYVPSDPPPPLPDHHTLVPPNPSIAPAPSLSSTTPILSTNLPPSTDLEKADDLLRVPPQPEELGRYCRHCQLVRPQRAHHDRVSGECVLQFDHFCPWVGTAVGWGNHKAFLVFLLYSTLYTAFVLAVTALGLSRTGLNGFLISIVALSALFTSFTGPMFVSHLYYILINATTIEQLSRSSFHHSEALKLQRKFGFVAFNAKRRQMKLWKEEWGSLETDGNRWDLGMRRNWESVMGSKPWLWFLPLGRPLGDGLTFEMNARCGVDGVWRPRRDWPDQYQAM